MIPAFPKARVTLETETFALTSEVAMDPECRSRIRQDSAFYCRTRILSLKFEKPDPDPESLFNFGSGKSPRGHFLSKNIG